jgi:hypothetical protein
MFNAFFGGSRVSVSNYLERARECAALAERMTPEEKKKILEIAEAWLSLAADEAKEIAKLESNKRDGDKKPSR